MLSIAFSPGSSPAIASNTYLPLTDWAITRCHRRIVGRRDASHRTGTQHAARERSGSHPERHPRRQPDGQDAIVQRQGHCCKEYPRARRQDCVTLLPWSNQACLSRLMTTVRNDVIGDDAIWRISWAASSLHVPPSPRCDFVPDEALLSVVPFSHTFHAFDSTLSRLATEPGLMGLVYSYPPGRDIHRAVQTSR